MGNQLLEDEIARLRIEILKVKLKEELLKDRRDYRAALITRRNGIDVKLKAVEQEISQLTKGDTK